MIAACCGVHLSHNLHLKTLHWRGPKEKKTRNSATHFHPGLQYFRRVGLLALILGGAALLFGVDYTLWVGCLYFFFACFLLDVWFDSELRHSVAWRWVLTLSLVAAMIVFSWKVTFAHAPILVEATGLPGPYGVDDDGKIAGIKWEPWYYQLQVSLQNPTDRDYTNIDLHIGDDRGIAGIGQLSNVSNVTFTPPVLGATGVYFDNLHHPIRTDILTIASFGPGTGYEVYCENLRAHDMLLLVVAVVENDNNSPGPYVRDPRPDWAYVWGQYRTSFGKLVKIHQQYRVKELTPK